MATDPTKAQRFPLLGIKEFRANAPEQISIQSGEVLVGIRPTPDERWWVIEKQGRRGVVPKPCVKLTGPPYFIDKTLQTSNSSGFGSQNQMQQYQMPVIAPSPAQTRQQPSPFRSPQEDMVPSYYNGNLPQPGASAEYNANAPLAPKKISIEKPVATTRNGVVIGKRKIKVTPPEKLQFTLYAHNISYGAALSCIVLGALGFLWNEFLSDDLLINFQAVVNGVAINETFLIRENLIIAEYTLGFGALLYIYEYLFGLYRSKPLADIPFRGLFILLASGPMYLTDVTVMAGVITSLSGIFNIIADLSGEHGDARKVAGSYIMCCENQKENEKYPSKRTFCESITATIFSGQFMFMFVYVGISIGLAVQYYLFFFDAVVACQTDPTLSDEQKAVTCPSQGAPFAKMFGQLLNFNCALILIPVIKIILTKLNDTTVNNKSIAQFIPLRKNIIFHKLIALVVAVSTFGHIVAHFINFPFAPEATLSAFTLFPWLTGIVITVAMIIIYSGAQNRVKRANYELFWASHHWFLVFFTFLIAHGPSFYIWAAIPVILYVLERIYRPSRGMVPFVMKTVRFIDPVLQLEFCPRNFKDFVYREGQYLYICVPFISENEWHPFTISSSFQDLAKDGIVTLHIKVMGPGSWTFRLKELFKMMVRPKLIGKNDRFELNLRHFDKPSKKLVLGRQFMPDGITPIILIDGPHSAPAQHYSEYDDALVIGAGIGLTPVASIMKAVLRYKWKLGYQPKTVHFYWIVRHSEVDSFAWYIKLLYELSVRVAADRRAGSIGPEHRLDINIFVSSVPRVKSTMRGRGYSDHEGKESNSYGAFPIDDSPGAYQTPDPLRGMDTNIGFTQLELHQAILNPTQQAKNQGKMQQPNNFPDNRFGDIWIWEGRPDWGEIFSNVKKNRMPGVKKVCVAFCGTPAVGKDLKRECRTHSKLDECMFDLHKENF